MQANNLFEFKDKIVDAFKDGTFSSKNLIKSDAAAYDYVLNDVNDFIQEIKSIEQKINLGLFEDFFELLPADYAKTLINIKNADENKEIVGETKDRMSDLKDRIKRNEWSRKKNIKMQVKH